MLHHAPLKHGIPSTWQAKMSSLNASDIAAHYPRSSEKHLTSVIIPQIQHRLDLITRWVIQPGEKVLEIGCGQGDCTITLAGVVGENGHVTAVDPAPLDYGTRRLIFARFLELILV